MLNRYIIFSIFLFLAPTVYAGCWGTHHVFLTESDTPDCFSARPESCLSRVKLTNGCDINYRIYNLTNCAISDQSNFAFAQKYHSDVLSFFHKTHIDILPNWSLTFFHPSEGADGTITLYYLYNHTEIDIVCESETIKEKSYALLIDDRREMYEITGEYEKKPSTMLGMESSYVYSSILLIIGCSVFFIYFNFFRKNDG